MTSVRSIAESPPRRRGRAWLEIALALALSPIAAYVFLRYALGKHAVRHIADDQVAVVVDNASGERRIVTTPGYVFVLPWLQDVYCLDKSPNAFLMQGNEQDGANHVPRLLVRSKDGSSYTFHEMTLQYALIPDAAGAVLGDSGPGDGFKLALVRAHARSVLRDEIGRYGVDEIVRPDVMQAATRASLERMNVGLNAHGIEILEIATPKPSFDAEYEGRISRRKVFNQDAERLKGDLERLVQEKAQRETRVQNEKDVELRALEGNLARDVKAAEKDAIREQGDADIEYLEKSRAAAALKVEREGQAAVLTASYRAAAQDLEEETRALERFGEIAVRAALVKKLAGVEFNLIPYNRDPSPKRVEYEDVAAAKLKH
jgi:hypothetical protein